MRFAGGSGEHTAPEVPPLPPKPCCARLPNQHGWCVLHEGHDGGCLGYPTQPKPTTFPEGTKP